jgi:pimeloyl-ACP methyl ester carboxylesterase
MLQIDREIVDIGPAQLELLGCGRGPGVLLLPSLGRDAGDFRALMGALANAGFRALALNPRGVGASRGPNEGITLHDLARERPPSSTRAVGPALGTCLRRRSHAPRRPAIPRRRRLVACAGWWWR